VAIANDAHNDSIAQPRPAHLHNTYPVCNLFMTACHEVALRTTGPPGTKDCSTHWCGTTTANAALCSAHKSCAYSAPFGMPWFQVSCMGGPCTETLGFSSPAGLCQPVVLPLAARCQPSAAPLFTPMLS